MGLNSDKSSKVFVLIFSKHPLSHDRNGSKYSRSKFRILGAFWGTPKGRPVRETGTHTIMQNFTTIGRSHADISAPPIPLKLANVQQSGNF